VGLWEHSVRFAAILLIDLVVPTEAASELGATEDELEVVTPILLIHFFHDLPIYLHPIIAIVLQK